MKITEPDPSDPESIKEHLDGLIEYWRKEKQGAETEEFEFIAECNIDSFQNVRKNIFGELKQ